MSDTFDPDAWPHTPSSGPPASGGNADRRNDDDDDDYDTLDLNEAPNYDDDDYDSSTFGGGGESKPDTAGAGYDDDYDDDDYGAGVPDPVPSTRSTATDDDFSFDDDDTATIPARTSGRGGRNYDDDDDSYDKYDSYDDDDGYDDDYDNFNNDDSSSGGGIRKFLIAGAAIIVVLLLALALTSLLGGKKSNKEATNTTATTAKNGDSSTTAVAGTEQKPTDDINTGFTQALAAWGKFAVTGDLDTVRPYFVNSGPEFTRFQAEAPTIQAAPPGGDPLKMEMKDPKTVKVDDNNWVYQGTVVVSRTGEKDQTFPWEIRVQRQNDQQPWQIFSVRQY